MARLVFTTPESFEQYIKKFSGTGRAMLLEVGGGEFCSLVLRPLVTSKGVDTAEIHGLSLDQVAGIWGRFLGEKYVLSRVVWRDDEPEVRSSE